MNMLSFELILLFAFLLFSKGYAPSVTPCEQTINCNINCGDKGTPICANNTCWCQRCDLYPPDDVEDESNFTRQK
ncbi:hypothetical protein P3L10_001145 [Capsicum annuum]